METKCRDYKFVTTYLMQNELKNIIGEIDEIEDNEDNFKYRTVLIDANGEEYYEYFQDLLLAKKYLRKNVTDYSWNYSFERYSGIIDINEIIKSKLKLIIKKLDDLYANVVDKPEFSISDTNALVISTGRNIIGTSEIERYINNVKLFTNVKYSYIASRIIDNNNMTFIYIETF